MTAADGATPLIEMRAVTKVIESVVPVTLVSTINLAIQPGEFVAVTGPSGSGKSSLLYLLGLLDLPTSGEVLIQGRNSAHMDEAARAQARLSLLGFVFQFHFLLPEFSAFDNVLLPMRALGELDGAAMRERASSLLASLGLAEHTHKLPEQMSGGQRQRVAIARALANNPQVVLADEPTGNLDSASSRQVLAIFRKLVDETGRAVVIVTHDMELAAEADRHVRIVDGKLVPP
jgi:lipoprotein-releasing system ATP-binding protein